MAFLESRNPRKKHRKGTRRAGASLRKRRKGPGRAIYLALAIIAGSLAVVVALLPREPQPPVRLPDLASLQGENEPASAAASAGRAGTGGAPAAHPAARAGTALGRLMFVIDDVGYNIAELKPFLAFPGPLTLSILPHAPYSLDAYRLILDAGKLPILHQPMEADGKVNPGPGAIYTSMSPAQIAATIAQNLQGMSSITWVNNHEGSKATSDPATMLSVLTYLKSRDLRFLDSRTTVDTVVPAVDKRLGLPYYERNSIFLDDSVNEQKIETAIDSGLEVARREGYAVMIGHVWDKDLARILIDIYPKLIASGFAVDDLRALDKESLANADTGN